MANFKCVLVSARLSISVSLLCTPQYASAWCAAMGGYPSFEAKRRAEEQQAAEERRRQAEAQRAAAEAQQSQRTKQESQTRTDQLALTKLGYYSGPVNGQSSKGLASAIADFHAANNLENASTLNDASRRLIERGEAISKANRQKAAAILKAQSSAATKARVNSLPEMQLK